MLRSSHCRLLCTTCSCRAIATQSTSEITSAPVGNLITYQSSLSDSNGDVSRSRDTGGSDAIVARHRVRGGLRVGAAAASQRPDLAQCALVLGVRRHSTL